MLLRVLRLKATVDPFNREGGEHPRVVLPVPWMLPRGPVLVFPLQNMDSAQSQLIYSYTPLFSTISESANPSPAM